MVSVLGTLVCALSLPRTYLSSQWVRHGPLLSDRLGGTPLRHRLGEHGWGSPGTRCVIVQRYPRSCMRCLHTETKFHVKPLPHARIPIVKLSLDPKPGLPYGIACDIGFENRLALENTRLLMCYAMIDPMRVRTMVLFRECLCSKSPSKRSRSHDTP